MNKKTKIWLWVAIVISACTTILNLTYGRIPSVVIAIVSIVGLFILLFKEKKIGFQLVCVCYILSFIIGIVSGISEGTGVFASVIMSLIGSALIPGITALFLKGQWDRLH